MTGKRPFRVTALAGLLMVVATAAAAQTVQQVGNSNVALDRRLARLLATDPLIITADRRVPVGDTLQGPVLVLDATVILEGTVIGDLVVVDAGVFVRHEAVVTGDLVNIAGGLYRSELARIGGTIIDLPLASYRVIREEGDRFVIEATRTQSRWELDGFGGLRPPTYDRVNGLALSWGTAYRLPRVRGITPRIRAHVGWRTSLSDPLYGAALELGGPGGTATVEYEVGAQTEDNWAVSDIRNSLNYLWDGDDYRDYHDAERVSVRLTREFGDIAKRFHAVFQVTGRMEDATSLAGSNPLHVFGDDARANPAVDDGRISSVVGQWDMTHHGLKTELEATLGYEMGGTWLDGDHEFGRATARVHFAMQGLFDHTLEIGAYGQMPVTGDTLPRQRWTLVGGPLTLSTMPTGSYKGDHALFARTRYRIRLPHSLRLPILGPPEVQLIHAAGRAWLADDDNSLVQEIGARLQFVSLYVQYMIQPSDTGMDALVVGLTWPFAPGYRWEP